MAENFYVPAKDGTPVLATWMTDVSGNYVYNPATGQPYVVPADFDMGKFIAEGNALEAYARQVGVAGTAAIYSGLYHDFHAAFPGSEFDLQRTYNGYHAVKGGDFVPAFTPAASYVYGVVSSAAGLTGTETLIGGGLQNLISSRVTNVDLTGDWWNASANVPNIMGGYQSVPSHGELPQDYAVDRNWFVFLQADGYFQKIDSMFFNQGGVETLVQIGYDSTGATHAVSIQTAEWGVVFKAGGDSSYWNNATQAPPENVAPYPAWGGQPYEPPVYYLDPFNPFNPEFGDWVGDDFPVVDYSGHARPTASIQKPSAAFTLDLEGDAQAHLDELLSLARFSNSSGAPMHVQAVEPPPATGNLLAAFASAALRSHDDGDQLITFQFKGNTYIYQDASGNGTVDSADHVIKLVGNVDVAGILQT